MGQTVKCPFCGSKKLKSVFGQAKSKIYNCQKCDLVFRWPQPTREEIQAFYDEKKHLENAYFAGLKKNYDLNNPAVKLYKKELEKISRILAPGKILDIGCAYGVFLDLAREFGWTAKGIEVAKKSSDYARKNFKLDVFTGTLEEARIPANSFRLVTLWDVAEHLTDPTKTFKEINRILEKNGLIFILTIDVSSLIGQLANASSKTKDFLYDHQHNYFFSKKVLAKHLKSAGFKDVQILDTAGAQISRWHSREIPLAFILGTNFLDFLAKILGKEYRQIVIARKV